MPESARSRSVLRSAGVVVLFAFLATLTWVFPALYANRYERPPVLSTVASAAPKAVNAVPRPALRPAALHPKPSAEQDRIYASETLRKAPYPGVAVEGRDGYLFLGDNYLSNFAQALGRRYYSPEEVARTAATIESERSWLKALKISTEFIVAPAKWSIYPDKLPAWAQGQSQQHILDQLLSYDPRSILDLRPDLAAARTSHQPYSQKNSHWTPYGGYIAYKSVVRQLAIRHPDLGTLRLPKLSSVTTVNEQNEFAALINDPGPNDWTVPHFTPGLAPYDVILPNGARTTQAPGTTLDITQAPLQTVSATAGNNHRVLILGDSTLTSLSPYLATAFGSTLIVRHFIDIPDQAPSIPALVERYHPDLVLTITSERNLNEPIRDLSMWQSAVDYDRALKSSTSSWTAAGATGSTISVAGATNLSGPLTLTLPKSLTTSTVVKIHVDSSAPAVVELRGTTTAGPFSIPLRIGPGPTTTFATVPAGITGQRLSLIRISDSGALATTEISARGLP
jgi:SGNH hydrolase-like domain, acetyltransferase AlgX